MFSFHWIKSLLAYFGFKKNARLLVIGPENAGKSTLVSMLRTGKFVQHTHSTWPYVEEIDIDLIRFTAYIMSGHPLLRKLWSDYCSKIEGILFMMDCADSEIFEAVKEELGSTIRADLNPGVPIAILFNKTDKKEAVGEEYLSEKLNLGEHRTGKKMDCLELLSGYQEELDEFVKSESDQKSAERPMWPGMPTGCPVTECSAELYSNFSSFERHWNNKHEKSITLCRCPNCSFSSARKFNVKRHQTKTHKMESNIEFEVVENKKFVDPKNRQPYRFNHRERMREKRKCIVIQVIIKFKKSKN